MCNSWPRGKRTSRINAQYQRRMKAWTCADDVIVLYSRSVTEICQNKIHVFNHDPCETATSTIKGNLLDPDWQKGVFIARDWRTETPATQSRRWRWRVSLPHLYMRHENIRALLYTAAFDIFIPHTHTHTHISAAHGLWSSNANDTLWAQSLSFMINKPALLFPVLLYVQCV